VATLHSGRLRGACPDRRAEVERDRDNYAAPHVTEGTPPGRAHVTVALDVGRDDVTDLNVGAVRRIESVTGTDEAFELRLEFGEFALPRPDVLQFGQREWTWAQGTAPSRRRSRMLATKPSRPRHPRTAEPHPHWPR